MTKIYITVRKVQLTQIIIFLVIHSTHLGIIIVRIVVVTQIIIDLSQIIYSSWYDNC